MRPNAILTLLLCLLCSSGLADEAMDDCNAAMSNAASLNANELWKGATSCGNVGDMSRGTFLLLAGQIRAMTDMSVLDPATDWDEGKVGDLYGVLYYRAGGSGDDELLRDRERTANLFRELRGWNPALAETYDPGWSYKSNVDVEYYANMIACQRELRIVKLEWYAGLVRNDGYYEAQKELEEFVAANPDAMTVGSEEHAKRQEIAARMNAHSSDAPPMSSRTPPECEFALATQYEPDPDADFWQLYSGGNGPGDSKAEIFESSDDVLSSWIAQALSTDELGQLLGEVDFDSQVVVSLTFGERQNATGTIHLSEVDYSATRNSLYVAGLIGVTEPGCDEPRASSYPFVLGVAQRPATVPGSRSTSRQNFNDGCKPIMGGSRTVKPE